VTWQGICSAQRHRRQINRRLLLWFTVNCLHYQPHSRTFWPVCATARCVCNSRTQFLSDASHKTHLRASMSDSRLSNLALIAVERELSEKLMHDPAEVIDAFATSGFGRSGKRRLELLL